ncbi:uncharacterized protein BXZ73DRAFT_82678 [Epithele typhae]|uniref:uncharacterized protein n=1 Tax=Epithele typhae TaxID=378194 RepID=UPI0020074A75|nr:uncharacterized protein BXZ73DRAFT_82678 [Epithele typhae]KAH9911689.1 hypothetical protein BXZ73DRAFT_82678 [Epithele typhae]
MRARRVQTRASTSVFVRAALRIVAGQAVDARIEERQDAISLREERDKPALASYLACPILGVLIQGFPGLVRTPGNLTGGVHQRIHFWAVVTLMASPAQHGVVLPHRALRELSVRHEVTTASTAFVTATTTTLVDTGALISGQTLSALAGRATRRMRESATKFNPRAWGQKTNVRRADETARQRVRRPTATTCVVHPPGLRRAPPEKLHLQPANGMLCGRGDGDVASVAVVLTMLAALEPLSIPAPSPTHSAFVAGMLPQSIETWSVHLVEGEGQTQRHPRRTGRPRAASAHRVRPPALVVLAPLRACRALRPHGRVGARVEDDAGMRVEDSTGAVAWVKDEAAVCHWFQDGERAQVKDSVAVWLEDGGVARVKGGAEVHGEGDVWLLGVALSISALVEKWGKRGHWCRVNLNGLGQGEKRSEAVKGSSTASRTRRVCSLFNGSGSWVSKSSSERASLATVGLRATVDSGEEGSLSAKRVDGDVVGGIVSALRESLGLSMLDVIEGEDGTPTRHRDPSNTCGGRCGTVIVTCLPEGSQCQGCNQSPVRCMVATMQRLKP